MGSMLKDWFSKKINKEEFKQKDKFLTGIEKEDYSKEEQILYTHSYYLDQIQEKV